MIYLDGIRFQLKAHLGFIQRKKQIKKVAVFLIATNDKEGSLGKSIPSNRLTHYNLSRSISIFRYVVKSKKGLLCFALGASHSKPFFAFKKGGSRNGARSGCSR